MNKIGDIDIPAGALFYPCSGSDTCDPLYMFMDQVNEFHFADMGSIMLPNVERPNMVSRRIPDMLLDQSLVKAVRSKGRISIPFEKSNNPINVRHVSWELTGDEDRNVDIYCWRTNAKHLLPFLKSIAVYYYRGDGHGEGGSGLDWLNSNWFDQVLEKMPNGALILTDCGNVELSDKPTVPWSKMPIFSDFENRSVQEKYFMDNCQDGFEYDEEIIDFVENADNLNFEYAGRAFKHIGIYGKSCKGWPVHGWQIGKIGDE